MSLKTVFGKVARGVGIGAKSIWKGFYALDDALDKIPLVEDLMVAIPVVGPALSFALKRVDIAQEMFAGPGQGKNKREWAEAQLRKDLHAAGMDEELAHELVAVAFLLAQRRAGVTATYEAPPAGRPLTAEEEILYRELTPEQAEALRATGPPAAAPATAPTSAPPPVKGARRTRSKG